MLRSLLFHSFNNKQNEKANPFYNLKISEYNLLIIEISKLLKPEKYTITFDDGYKSIIPAIKFAHEFGFKTKAYIVTNKINKKGFLSEKDILELFLNGTVIGSHSKNHFNLTKLNDKQLELELKESKLSLMGIIKSEVEEISLPYGEYNKKVLNKSKLYYSKIALSRPLFLNEKSLIGRLSIHRSNFKQVNFIASVLKDNRNFLFLLKLFITDFLKKILPLSMYRSLKSLILFSRSTNYF